MPTQHPCETCLLRSRCVYTVLNKEQRQSLQGKRIYNRKKKGTVLFQEGFPAYSLFMIVHGLIKHTKTGRSEKEFFVGFRKDGDLAGLVSLASNAIYPGSGVCITDTTFCTIPSDLMRQFLAENKRVADYLFVMFGDVIAKVGQRVGELVECTTQQRVARSLTLLNAYVPVGGKGFDMKREDLALLAGTTRETVSRILANLKREKIIAIKRSAIQVLKPQRLTEMGAF